MKEEIISIETVVSKMLIEKNLTISTAESCNRGACKCDTYKLSRYIFGIY